MATANQPPAAGAPAPPAQLYVVLHGLISLVDHGDAGSLTAVLIDMGTDHRYMAGTWLNEQPLESGSHLQLMMPGAPGVARLDTTQNPVVRVTQGTSLLTSFHSALKSFLVHSVIDLPRPDEILYFTKGALSGITGPGTVQGTPQFLAGTKILRYQILSPDNIRLSGGTPIWICPALTAISDPSDSTKVAVRVAVLHVYNHPVKLVDGAHNKLEFERASAFLGAKLTLTAPVLAPPPDQPPLGLLEDELTCLAHRELSVLRMVGHMRNGTPIIAGQAGGCGSEVCGCPDGDA